jgi:hypothetical protein
MIDIQSAFPSGGLGQIIFTFLLAKY